MSLTTDNVLTTDPMTVDAWSVGQREALGRGIVIGVTRDSACMVERACATAGFSARVVAEIESVPVLTEAFTAGLGATVLPRTIAEALRRDTPLGIRRIISPAPRAPLSLCQMESPPESPTTHPRSCGH